ncbi:MAG: hypothetical protein ACREBS_11440 [Nitrososphaerales archaeon]
MLPRFAIERNVGVEGSRNFSTTLVSPGNHANRESAVAYFSSNGSEISTGGVGGYSSASYTDIADLQYFYPIVIQSFSKGRLSAINKTTITSAASTEVVCVFKVRSCSNCG